MKAAVHRRYGPPEVVLISEVDKPAPGYNEVLVKLHATTVNRTDCACRAARPFFMRLFTGLLRPRAPVLGNEFAGAVETVGSGVTSFQAGDKVFGYNEGPFGAHAEYMSIPADGSLAAMPANVTDQQAAPSTEGSHYALAHIRAAKIRSGQDVLVYGATGAICSAAGSDTAITRSRRSRGQSCFRAARPSAAVPAGARQLAVRNALAWRL